MSILKYSFLLCVVFTFLLGCSDGSDIERANDPETKRNLGLGELVGLAGTDHYVWLGVPFAIPPTGELRWRAARHIQPWKGVLEATSQPEPCVQIASVLGGADPEDAGKVIGSEDCLYANIYTPKLSAREAAKARLPVLYWIHGGGNIAGSTASYDFSRMAAEQNVVVVAVQYRLGPFGFFYHSALIESAEDGKLIDKSSNQGVIDLIIGLVWVNRNISAFGGDPKRVTIFGESAGGHNVMALLSSPGAADFFHRAIVQSGSDTSADPAYAENVFNPSDPEVTAGHVNSSREQVIRWALEVGLVDTASTGVLFQRSTEAKDLADWMQTVDAEIVMNSYIIESASEGFDPESLSAPPPRIVDDAYLFKGGSLVGSLYGKDGPAVDVPVIVGFNRDEMKLFTGLSPENVRTTFFGAGREIRDPEKFEADNEYRSKLWGVRGAHRLARHLKSLEKDVWVYRFEYDDWPTWPIDFSEIFGAAHAFEIPFVMGYYGGFKSLKPLYENTDKTNRDLLSTKIREYWTNFAASGNPNRRLVTAQSEEGDEWLSYNQDNNVMVLDAESKLERSTMTAESLFHIMLRDNRLSLDEKCAIVKDTEAGDLVVRRNIDKFLPSICD